MSLRGTAAPGQYLTGSINKVTYQIISAYGVAVKNGFKGTEEEWLLSLQANPELIARYVHEYLEENPVATDATLSNSGMAADAKVTGDAIQNAKNEAKAYTDTHSNSKANPHGVTKEQVGLGNVDNTSDMDKPVSTAQAEAIEDAKKAGLDAVPKSGGTMTGPLNVPNPTEASHAANKDFVEKYFASQKFYRDIVLTSTGWVGESAPFTQTIAVDGILESDRPHYGPVHSENVETALLEKENWAMVDDMTTADGSATFFCFEEKPVVDIAVQLEVHR